MYILYNPYNKYINYKFFHINIISGKHLRYLIYNQHIYYNISSINSN